MRFFVCISFLSLLLLNACEKERFTTDSSDVLSFSLDTLRFDTVFTELGSATRFVKVYNTHKRSIRISSIHIDGGEDSFFRLNIDGISSNMAENVEIGPEDSLYIFAEVTVDPDNPISFSPFIINDEIILITNGNTQSITLEAWGQNANYIPSQFNNGGLALLSCDLQEESWDDPRPYVIYGILLIDSCTLIVPAGAQIYIHGGIASNDLGVYNDGIIFLLPQGRINVQGTLDNPVTIQGDRLEDPFQDIPGQWAGIRIGPGSKGNSMSHTTIRNSIVGVRVDSAADLRLENCQVYNTSGSGLIGIRSRIEAENCLFYNSFGNTVQLEYGGVYDFDYCTIASYGVDRSALRITNILCADANCNSIRTASLTARFQNCIVYGSLGDEIEMFDAFDGNSLLFNYSFDNCIVRVDELDDPDQFPDFFTRCSPCINASPTEPIFEDPNEDLYRLDTFSIAIGKAAPIPGIEIDLEGKTRDPVSPDMGCYEYE